MENGTEPNGRVVTDDNVGPLLTGMARGITEGLSITLGHFWAALTDYLRGSPNRTRTPDGVVQTPTDHGAFTVHEKDAPVYFPRLGDHNDILRSFAAVGQDAKK